MDDLEIDRILFEGQGEPEPVPAWEDPLDSAQQRAEAAGLDCRFQSSEDVLAAVDKASLSTKAVLRASLGLGGPIRWTTLPMPWADPRQMENRLGQECLWVPSRLGSYSHETVQGFHHTAHVASRAHLLEYDVQRFLERHDPAAPLVIRTTFTGYTPRDEMYIADLESEIESSMYFRGAYGVEVQGRKLMLSLPLTDSRGTVSKEVPYDFYVALFSHLGNTGKGERGALRFSVVSRMLSPGLERTEHGLERGPVQVNRCSLVAPRQLPSSAAVARFFDISTVQVEAAVQQFFCPPAPVYVPPHGPKDRVMTAK